MSEIVGRFADMRWWEAEEATIAERVVDVMKSIDKRTPGRTALDLRHARLYGNHPYLGLGISTYMQTDAISVVQDDRLRFNVIKSCVDAVLSRIGSSKPLPQFLTDEGDWSQQRRAAKLTRYVEGMFYDSGAHKRGRRVIKDAMVFGSGLGKVVRGRDGRPQLERTLPFEVIVDPADALYGEPRSMYQIRWVDKDVLVDMYCKPIKNAEERAALEMRIRSASYSPAEMRFGQDQEMNQACVIEAWHLPSGPKADDGRHVLCVDTALLNPKDTEWKRERFPFAEIRWSEPILGWWGDGIARELTSIQVEINWNLQKIQKILTLHAQPMILVRAGSRVALASIATNALGSVHYVTDPKDVQVVTPPPLTAELMATVNMLIERAYQLCGVSQLAAQSMKPAGLDSGRAIRAFADQQSERFREFSNAIDEFYLDVGELYLDEARSAAKDGKPVKTRAPGKKGFAAVDWAAVEMDRDDYVMKVFPVSSLPSTPAGRLQTVSEMIAAGFVSKQEGQRLLDFPDLDAYATRTWAAWDAVESQLEKILDGDESVLPEPTQDVGYAALRATQQLNLCIVQNAPASVRDALREYLETVDGYKKLAEAAVAPPAPTPAAPGAVSPPPAPVPGAAGGSVPMAA